MTDVSVLSGSEAIKFLEWLDPKGLHNLVAIDPVTKAVEAQIFDFNADFAKLEAEAWVRGRNSSVNLYFSINEPRADARRDSKLRRDEIGAVRAFHVDIDNLDGTPDWDMDCMPSAVVDSGNGQWGFWKLDAPLPVDDVAAIEAQNRALTGRFHGDTQAHNLDRIARLPGTLNIPNEAKRKKGRVEVVSKVLAATALTYAPAEVAAWCAPLAVSQSGVDHTQNGKEDVAIEVNSPAVIEACLSLLDREDLVAIAGAGGRGVSIETLHALMDEGATADMAAILSHHRLKTEGEDWELHDLKKLARGLLPSRKMAIGALSAEAEFADETASAQVRVADEKAKRPPLLHISAIKRDVNAPSRYLIEGIYDCNAFVVTYGESNTGKSNVVLNQSLHIAAGLPWRGRQVKQGMVVYVAAEGAPGLKDRVEAYQADMPEIDWSKVPFYLWAFPADFLHSNADADFLIEQIQALELETGHKCVAVKLDTLSRLLAGGDENTSVDMGKMVMRCGRVQSAIGCSVHLVHHAGKNTAKGARGHSSLRAAVDTEIEIENKTIICRKQRDMDFFSEMRFDYSVVELPSMADGTARNSIVLTDGAVSDFTVDVTPQTQKVLEAAIAIITQKTQIAGPDACSDSAKLSPKELKALALPERTVDRALAELADSGMLVKCKRGLYKLNLSAIPPNFRQ